MHHPEKLSGTSISALDEIIKSFPYFQTAHLLYLKNLHAQNSIHYNNQLKIAAAYSGDRKVLYHLIHSKPVSTTIENKIERKIDVQETPNEKIVETVFKEIKTEPQQEASLTELGKEIMSEVISSYIEMEVGQEINKTKEENKPAIIENSVPEAKIKGGKIDFSKTYSFLDWLKITDKSISIMEKQQIIEEKSTQSLIEKFIAEEPRISKPKAEFFSPVNLARKSIIEDGSIVSETLAEIYEKQGHYLKAIKSYEMLSLKYPEKKLSFAIRIKELKKKIIS